MLSYFELPLRSLRYVIGNAHLLHGAGRAFLSQRTSERDNNKQPIPRGPDVHLNFTAFSPTTDGSFSCDATVAAFRYIYLIADSS